MDPISALLDIGDKLIGHFFPNPKEADDAKLKLLQMQQDGTLKAIADDTELKKAQMAINQAEAESNSTFVAGWRPFIGWVCGSAFAYAFVVQPFLTFLLAALNVHTQPLPTVSLDSMMPVLLGMLGLGGMRSFEKYKGVAGPKQSKG